MKAIYKRYIAGVIVVLLLAAGGFSDSFGSGVYRGEPNSVSIQINTAGNEKEMVGGVITSPAGKQGGYNPALDKHYNEFEEGSAVFTEYMPSCVEEEDCGPIDIYGIEGLMRLSENGIYTIELIGMDTTIASVSIFVMDRPNNKSYNTTAYVAVDKEVIRKFELVYESSSTTSPVLVRVATAVDLKRDIAGLYQNWLRQSGRKSEYRQFYIDNEGIMNSLLKKAEAAEDAANRGQYKAAVNQLKALINEVKAQTGKHLDERAATILTEDAEYLIKELEAK